MEGRDCDRDNLLERTTTILRTVLQELESPRDINSTPDRAAGSSNPPVSSAAADFRRAFPGLSSRNIVRPPMRRAGPPMGHGEAPCKKKRNMMGYVPFRALETWTHEFCVLGKVQEDKTPNRERMEILLNAGLGKAKLVFPDKKADHQHVQEFLEEKFPKLKVAGGFEVLRASGGGGGQRSLTLVPPSREGYTVPHLKERLGQAIAHIRPLQVDLDETPAIYTLGDDSPKVECVNCHSSIPMLMMRGHQMECGGGSSAEHADLQSREGEKQENIGLQISMEQPEVVLKGMFPNIPIPELKCTLQSSAGDVNKAAELLLLRQTTTTDDSDDDDNNELAIPAWDTTKTDHGIQELDIIQIMTSHRIQLNTVEVNRFTVDREELWSDSIILFKSPSFNPQYPLRIRFHGEPGVDAGGLSQEFSTLLRNALFSSEARLFEGKSDRRLPIYNGDAVLANLFVLAGKMCSYLISHCDVGIPCLTDAAYTYLCTGDIEAASQKCRMEDIPDPDMQDIISKVTNATTANGLSEVTSDSFTDALMAAGWIKSLTVENKDVAMWQLVAHETLLKRKTPLDHFREGLKVLNLLKLVQSYPEQMSVYFTNNKSPLGKEVVISLFNNLEREDPDEAIERSRGYFIQAIGDLQEERGTDGLKSFLSFLTGLEEIPPLGLPSKIDVKYMKDGSKTLFAETCLMALKLPTVHTEYSKFKENFMLACSEGSVGFGCA